MKYLGRLVVGVVVVAVVAAALGCSGESEAERAAATATAVAEAERVAEAALLVEGDLPAGDWVVEDSGLEEFEQSRPDWSDWPEACGPAPTQPWYGDEVLAVRGRSFTAGDSGGEEAASSQEPSIGLIVLVFESAEEAEKLLKERDEQSGKQPSEECQDALDPQSGARSFESLAEEPHYALSDETARRISIVNKSTGEIQVTGESHSFQRGRVLASYLIVGSDEAPRGIDHQALLEAFEARVAAHGGG